MELKDILVYVVTPLVMLILSMFHIHLNMRFSNLKERIMKIEKDIDKIKAEEREMKDNYLDRFEKVLSGISDIKMSIVIIQGSVERQEQFCQIIQKQKDN